MKILVLSDSHRNTIAMEKIKQKEKPDLVLHLGDHEADCDYVLYDVANLRVRGNCDHNSCEEDERLIDMGTAKIWMTHGHLYGVKGRLGRFKEVAKTKGADIALYGHTHKAYLEKRDDGLIIMNPGTPDKSYGIITVDNNDNKYDAELIYL